MRKYVTRKWLELHHACEDAQIHFVEWFGRKGRIGFKKAIQVCWDKDYMTYAEWLIEKSGWGIQWHEESKEIFDWELSKWSDEYYNIMYSWFYHIDMKYADKIMKGEL